MSTLYKYILKPILFLIDPEVIHDAFISFGEFLGKFHLTRWVVGFFYDYHESARRKAQGASKGASISKVVDGIKYRTPVLLSAGFDYNGQLTQILPHIGFGGEEVGSVTARPCAGNPKPRLTRLPKSGSIIVNKGLRNDGVEAIIARIKEAGARRKAQSASESQSASDFVVGVSIARTNDEHSVDIQSGIDDYVYSFKRLNEEGIGDYYAINISCPNAFGGEAFTTPDLLTRLLMKLSTIPCTKPVYVKMPINLPWDQFN
ncbi:MAG: hypothetical protein WCO48_02460, partial [Candidatus Taylorbacteria bacterium]